jgi:hypothetical protein
MKLPVLSLAGPSQKLNGAAAALNGTCSHSMGITEMIEILADLERLRSDMDAAHAAKGVQINKAVEEKDTKTDAALLRSHNRFGELFRHADAKADALEELILELEPTTVDETLSLGLLFGVALDLFVGNHCDLENDGAGEREWQKLERALAAIIRGLVHGAGARSPLLKNRAVGDDLIPWAEARSTATREAVPYLVEYDPAKGCLKKMGAQP